MILINANLFIDAGIAASANSAWPPDRDALAVSARFLRIATNPRIYASPATVAEAYSILESWQNCPWSGYRRRPRAMRRF